MSSRTVGILVLLSLPLSVAGGEISGLGEVGAAIALSLIALGVVKVPGFLRSVIRGGIAGGLAGVLVLGPGMRGAMRIVALMDSAPLEFTLEGTAFLVLIFGGMFGAIVGGYASASADALRWTGLAAPVIASVAVGAVLASGPDVRSEFIDLGAGPLVNIPLFVLVIVGYAATFERLSKWRSPEPDRADLESVVIA